MYVTSSTGKDLSDLIKWVKFSGASWTKDGKGFFYSRYDEPKEATALRDTVLFSEALLPQAGNIAGRRTR